MSTLLRAVEVGLIYYAAFMLRLNYTKFLVFFGILTLFMAILIQVNARINEKEEGTDYGKLILDAISFYLIISQYGFVRWLGTLLLQFILRVFAGVLVPTQ